MKYKFYITNFYNVRNLAPNQVPFSTAVWDPAWFHDFHQDQNYWFFDKRGVINGLRAEMLNPSSIENHCGQCGHTLYDPSDCPFLRDYRNYLEKLGKRNLDRMIEHLENVAERMCFINHAMARCEIVLLVHEKNDNPCSERSVICEWFWANGYEINELTFNK